MAGGSIGSRIDDCDGVGEGFDSLRLSLACAVILYHSFGVTAAESFAPLEILAEGIVPAFFVLSGFLVTGSAMRSTLPRFLINRALRIFPALIALVSVSALVLGPLLTQLDVSEYFAASQTRQYFLAILGASQLELPGVFLEGHPEGAIHTDLHAAGIFNISLWTIRWEMICYALVAVLIASKLIGRPTVILALFVAVLSFRLGLYIAHPDVIQVRDSALGPVIFPALEMHNLALDMSLSRWTPNWFTNRLAIHVTSWQFRVIMFFIAGILLYHWRYRLCRRPAWALASAGVLVVVSAVFSGQQSTPVTTLLTVLPIAYLVGFVGTARIPLPSILKGDYSYGVYLWAFPIQQMVHLYGLDVGSPWLNTTISIPFALLAGCASWHWVERPILARRRFAIGRNQPTGERE
jgi:peptidoglycan/LPS O-acetylase OafA/YrhL